MRILLSLVPALCLSAYSFGADLTKEQKESYAVGASTGSYISNQLHEQAKLGVNSDVNIVIEGFLDAFKNKLKLSDDEIIDVLNQRAETLNKIVEKKAKDEIEKNKKEGKDFMAKNALNSQVKTTKSGVQYEILKSGNGEKPKPESIVVLNYKAYLPNGKVFDDTYAKKAPAHLSMINIIEGLAEGLAIMNSGAKYKFVIPSNLAYGDEGAGEIPGGAVVIFEAELLKVLKPGELSKAAKELSQNNNSGTHK